MAHLHSHVPKRCGAKQEKSCYRLWPNVVLSDRRGHRGILDAGQLALHDEVSGNFQRRYGFHITTAEQNDDQSVDPLSSDGLE